MNVQMVRSQKSNKSQTLTGGWHYFSNASQACKQPHRNRSPSCASAVCPWPPGKPSLHRDAALFPGKTGCVSRRSAPESVAGNIRISRSLGFQRAVEVVGVGRRSWERLSRLLLIGSQRWSPHAAVSSQPFSNNVTENQTEVTPNALAESSVSDLRLW